MQIIRALLTLLGASLAVASFSNEQFKVLHAVGSNPFTPRGQITPTEKKSIIAPKYQSSSSLDLSALRPSSSTPSPTELYHVKLVSATGVELESSIRLCLLQTAQFADSLTVHFDETGVPFHVDYSVDLGDKSGECDLKGETSSSKAGKAGFKTKVGYVKTLDGTRPRLDEMTANVAAGKTEGGEKTFLQKYWYYLVPLAIILLMSGEEPPKEGAAAAPAK